MTPDAAATVLAHCRALSWRLATAESCTGGLIAARLTEIAGSSDVVVGGIVAYHNDAKRRHLGVAADTLEREGAVSEAVALQMARGAQLAFDADLAVAVTGIAGPGGGTAAKPVGLVHLAVTARGLAPLHRRCVFPGDRRQIRAATVEAALDLLLEALAASAA
ncbi:MAG: nicotinamide-nucleotide amidohydrolase family protein [Geminicoccaceae bacterium]|nr:MAG: nicotinamide-nucleotide amidohydrolase family protein [Geminicoccaceae bacterium]